MVAFKQPHSLGSLLVWAEIATHNTTIGKSHSCGEKCCKYCRHMQHSSSYTSKVTGKQYNIFVLLIGRVQISFTYLSVPFVASNMLASVSSHSTNVWMDTGVTLQKSHFFLWASTSDCLKTVSRILTKWKYTSLNRTVCGVNFNVRIGKEFGLKNSVFYNRTVLTENIYFLSQCW
jgi:hypothetical protein